MAASDGLLATKTTKSKMNKAYAWTLIVERIKYRQELASNKFKIYIDGSFNAKIAAENNNKNNKKYNDDMFHTCVIIL